MHSPRPSFASPLLLLALTGTLASISCCSITSAAESHDRPNVLWIIVDDMSANFSCYGEKLIETPRVDALARRGTQFNKAFVTAPVCSTCRSAFITGMYQTSIGAHHHRSGRGEKKIELPEPVRLIPSIFQDAGYYTTISGWPIVRGRLGKTDYNFEWDPSIYDGADWSQRSDDQPFFAQIQLKGGKLRGGTSEANEKFVQRVEKTLVKRTNPDDVQLPPYYPRERVLLEDWAAYLDSVRETDRIVGEILDRLKQRGELESTVVVFMTDHGISHARGKQFLYDEGLHVPLVIAGPGVDADTQRNDLVEHIDIAALSLGIAGIEIPDWMQAKNILGKDYQPRDAVYAARDRCDETVEHLRSVRTNRFKYIRNFLHQRPYLQPNAYKDHKSILIALREAHRAGRLNETQSLLFADTRPPEELYDLEADPFEIYNLAEAPNYQVTLESLRQQLIDWVEATDDKGRDPEPMAMFDSDMAVYLNTVSRKQTPERKRILESNIAQMKQWASEGK